MRDSPYFPPEHEMNDIKIIATPKAINMRQKQCAKREKPSTNHRKHVSKTKIAQGDNIKVAKFSDNQHQLPLPFLTFT